MWVVGSPGRRFQVDIAAEEGVESLSGACPVGGGGRGGIVPLVVLAGFRQVSEIGVHVGLEGAGIVLALLCGVEGESGRAIEGVAHHDAALEEVGARKCTHRRGDCAEVVAYDAFHSRVSKGIDEGEHISDELRHGELA